VLVSIQDLSAWYSGLEREKHDAQLLVKLMLLNLVSISGMCTYVCISDLFGMLLASLKE
jgi:hypothetical protein